MRTAIIHAVLFIAVIAVAGTFAGMIITESTHYSESLENDGERTVAALDAEILIIDDPGAGAIYDAGNETVALHVKNIGGDSLEIDDLNLLIDGHYAHAESTSLDPHSGVWRVGTVLEIEVDWPLESGDHRAQITIDGATDVVEFTIE